MYRLSIGILCTVFLWLSLGYSHGYKLGDKCGDGQYKSDFLSGGCAKCPDKLDACNNEEVEDAIRCFNKCRPKTSLTVKPSFKVMPTPVAHNPLRTTLSTKARNKSGRTLLTAKPTLRISSTPRIRKSSVSTPTTTEQGSGSPNVSKVQLPFPTPHPTQTQHGSTQNTHVKTDNTTPSKPKIILHGIVRNNDTIIMGTSLVSGATLLLVLFVVVIVIKKRRRNEQPATRVAYTTRARNESHETERQILLVASTDQPRDVENATSTGLGTLSVSQQNFDEMRESCI